jgi:hypothetical protein
MRAPVRAMRPVGPGPAGRTRHDDVLLAAVVAAADHGREQAGDEEEDAVHDAEDPAGLEHGAGLVDVDAKRIHVRGAEDAEAQRVGLLVDVGARVAGDAAQVPDAGDEGADEAEVDEGDEVRVVARAVVGEEGEDGPHGRQDGDDEEDEDRGGREQVLRVVDVDEVGEHAERWDLHGETKKKSQIHDFTDERE